LAIYEKKRGKLPLSQGIAKHPTSTVIPTHSVGIHFCRDVLKFGDFETL